VTQYPLPFDVQASIDASGQRVLAAIAEARRDLGAARAESHADHVDPAWRERALAAVLAHAQRHHTFLMEDVHAAAPMPEGADPRAWGAIAKEARRRRWVHPHGYAPANSSNRGPKVLWLSLVRLGGAA
jgi:hypothetical protein